MEPPPSKKKVLDTRLFETKFYRIILATIMYIYIRQHGSVRTIYVRIYIFIYYIIGYLKSKSSFHAQSKRSGFRPDGRVSMARSRSSLGPDRRRGVTDGWPRTSRTFSPETREPRPDIRILERSSRCAKDGTGRITNARTRSRRASETNVAFLECLAPTCSAARNATTVIVFNSPGRRKQITELRRKYISRRHCVCTESLERSFVKYSYHLSFGAFRRHSENVIAGRAPNPKRTRKLTLPGTRPKFFGLERKNATRTPSVRKTTGRRKRSCTRRPAPKYRRLFQSITFERYTYNSHSIDVNNCCTRCNGLKRFNVFLA